MNASWLLKRQRSLCSRQPLSNILQSTRPSGFPNPCRSACWALGTCCFGVSLQMPPAYLPSRRNRSRLHGRNWAAVDPAYCSRRAVAGPPGASPDECHPVVRGGTLGLAFFRGNTRLLRGPIWSGWMPVALGSALTPPWANMPIRCVSVRSPWVLWLIPTYFCTPHVVFFAKVTVGYGVPERAMPRR